MILKIDYCLYTFPNCIFYCLQCFITRFLVVQCQVKVATYPPRYGYFSGINRKVQLKAMADKRNYDMLTKFKGRNKKSQTSVGNTQALLLILKWGGELTPMGKKQAEDLGRAFRCVYPGGQGKVFLH